MPFLYHLLNNSASQRHYTEDDREDHAEYREAPYPQEGCLDVVLDVGLSEADYHQKPTLSLCFYAVLILLSADRTYHFSINYVILFHASINSHAIERQVYVWQQLQILRKDGTITDM